MTPTVIGVDWYRRGWVAVVLEDDSAPRAVVGEDLESLIGEVPDPACIAIDMPIGLPATERQADVLARKFVGPRWQSVFITPPADVLAAETYAEANLIAARLLSDRQGLQALADPRRRSVLRRGRGLPASCGGCAVDVALVVLLAEMLNAGDGGAAVAR